jgi:hypothetical protein
VLARRPARASTAESEALRLQLGSLGGFPKAALQIGGQGNIDWAPVGFYVIAHPKGNLIFDTGNNDKTITDAEGWWGPLAKGFGLKMTKDDAIPAQLAKINMRPTTSNTSRSATCTWTTAATSRISRTRHWWCRTTN